MAFSKKTWLARLGSGLNKFKFGQTGEIKELINVPDEITQAGDALSAENLNNLEQRIYDGIRNPGELHGSGSTTTIAYPDMDKYYNIGSSSRRFNYIYSLYGIFSNEIKAPKINGLQWHSFSISIGGTSKTTYGIALGYFCIAYCDNIDTATSGENSMTIGAQSWGSWNNCMLGVPRSYGATGIDKVANIKSYSTSSGTISGTFYNYRGAESGARYQPLLIFGFNSMSVANKKQLIIPPKKLKNGDEFVCDETYVGDVQNNAYNSGFACLFFYSEVDKKLRVMVTEKNDERLKTQDEKLKEFEFKHQIFRYFSKEQYEAEKNL